MTCNLIQAWNPRPNNKAQAHPSSSDGRSIKQQRQKLRCKVLRAVPTKLKLTLKLWLQVYAHAHAKCSLQAQMKVYAQRAECMLPELTWQVSQTELKCILQAQFADLRTLSSKVATYEAASTFFENEFHG